MMMTRSTNNVTTAAETAPLVAAPSERRLASSAKPRKIEAGKTIQPLRRSKITVVKLVGRSPVSLPRRDTRMTSPPTVVGRKLDTNCPAKLCQTRRQVGTSRLSASQTCFHRRAARTTEPITQASAATSHATALPSSGHKMPKSTSTHMNRNTSRPALTPRRSSSMRADFFVMTGVSLYSGDLLALARNGWTSTRTRTTRP